MSLVIRALDLERTKNKVRRFRNMQVEKAATAGMLQVFGSPLGQDTGYPTLSFCIFLHSFQIKSREHNDRATTVFQNPLQLKFVNYPKLNFI
jgi:hypothetical protein